MKDFVIVKIFNTRSEAELAKGLLSANGIVSVVSADDEGGMAPFPLQVTSRGVQMLVKKENFRDAVKLLNGSS